MQQHKAAHARDGKHFGKRLFTFVVVADTHVNQEEGKTASPFAVNALANARARFVIEEINRLDPAFVIHLGDIVHPVPELPSYPVAAEQFKGLAKALKPRLYLVSGNHDMGDKPVEWMPAGTVTVEFVELYRHTFGADFYSFDANGCHYVVLNSQVINSGFEHERKQREWIERDLSESAGKRTFVAIHYPPYVADRHEPSNYDNIDEPGRSWLLGLIERYRPEALFCGHVHNFWYDQIGATECYLLPSTSFVRQDYAELYRIGPGPEQGRNEEEKLGYFVVEVYERGHVAHLVRTYGRRLGPSEKLPRPTKLPLVHTKTSRVAPVGVDVKHPWAEVIEVAATGGVQEFERKKARNDYPLMAMWEMGIRKMRVPLHDLLDPYVRSRMRILRGMGHEFTVYVFGVPDAEARRTMVEHCDLLAALEVVTPWSKMNDVMAPLTEFKALGRFPVYLSKLRKHEDAKYDGSHYSHFINHGFVLAEREQIAELFSRAAVREAADGVVFRVVRSRSPWNDVQAAHQLARDLAIRPAFQLRLAADNPAEVPADDLDNANRVAETVIAGLAYPDSDLILDTFDDIDRGYFSRNGLVDRRYNPRLAGLVYRHLHAALAARAPLKLAMRHTSADATVCSFAADGVRCAVILPCKPIGVRELPGTSAVPEQGELVDLRYGTREIVKFTRSSAGALALQTPVRCEHPLLFIL